MKKKKVWVISLILLSLILLTTIIVFITTNKFHIKNYEKIITIPYNNKYVDHPGNVCYGNKFKCHQTKIKTSGTIDTSKIGEYKIKYTYTYYLVKFKKYT